MNTNPNKQIVYRLEESDHRTLRLQAAEEGLTPNQYARKLMLDHINQCKKIIKKS
jgi:predicted HicB family RNase H-like nuclease